MGTISIVIILLVSLQSIIWTGLAKFIYAKRYNNYEPRKFLDKLEGKAQRAYWAHLNSLEALPFFLGAVICANISNIDANVLNSMLIIYFIMRILYGFCYIYNKANLRSLTWFISYAICFALYILSAL